MKRTARVFRSRLPWLLGASIAAISFASMAWAGSPATDAKAPKPEETTPQSSVTADAHAGCQHAVTTPTVSPAEAGMRAYIDPETGTIGGMPPVEAQPASPEAEPQLEQVFLPDGSVMVDLKGTGQEYFVLQMDANGNRVVRCVQDPKTVTAPVAPRREDR